jgi:putative hydrolase of the HAD superfamily
MIRALVCDWGGVLRRTFDVRPRMAWEARLGLPPRGLGDALFGAVWEQAEIGQGSLAGVFAALARDLRLDDGQLAALQEEFWAGDRLDDELVALLRDLRRKGVRTALLSNHVTELAGWLTELGLDDLFDVVVISACEGVAKPDPAIYRRALERLGVAPAEAIFVDDWWPNVEAAREVGMGSVRFRGTLHLRRALAAAGLSVDAPPVQPTPGIRAVIFDWGGVLIPLNFARRGRLMDERLGLAPGTVDRVLWGADWRLLEIGAISLEAYDAHVADGLGLPDRAALRRFYDEYYADDPLVPQVVAAVRSLRGRYEVGMITNAWPDHVERTRAQYDFDLRAEFDVYINSAEVGLAKPDPAIYQLALERLGVRPEEAVFLDDNLPNVDAARMLGMQGIVVTEPDVALADLAGVLGEDLPGLDLKAPYPTAR